MHSEPSAQHHVRSVAPGRPAVSGPPDASAVEELRALPRSEQCEALEDLVVTEFKATLLMDDGEEFPVTETFFDLGFTSLLIADAKQRLEQLLGCSISATVLFNSPTVERLVEHLADDVLALRRRQEA